MTTLSPDNWLREHAGVPEKIDLGLQRTQEVLKRLNLVPTPFEVITVAGTNGKGSTVAILDSILSEAGALTGRYSSPHLIRFNERILVAQNEQSDSDIVNALQLIKSKAQEIPLSYFEYATIAALLLFAQEGVDVALLEVGLGGRLDACNAVDSDIAVITSIALDHQDWLGNDIDVIGTEKAGIMRANKPCILAASNLPASVMRHANEIQAISISVVHEYAYYIDSEQAWTWSDSDTHMRLVNPSLAGEVQLQNAAAALAAIKQTRFWPIKESLVNQALKKIKLPGRLQTLQALQFNWLLDVAHNPASVEVLVSYLSIKHKQVPAVFAMLGDKDVDTCVSLLKSSISDWYICELDSPRSLSIDRLHSVLLAHGVKSENIHIHTDVEQACRHVADNSLLSRTILVCGSFYTVGSALEFLQAA